MNHFQPVILWTDALIAVLLVMILAFAWIIHHRPLLKSAWMKVYQHPVKMIAIVILVSYCGIGLLDSLHFRPAYENNGQGEIDYQAEVLSVLDKLLAPLPDETEKTYSAPFATHLYTAELQKANGHLEWERERLRYGGAHLEDPDKKWSDVGYHMAMGARTGFYYWFALVLVTLTWTFIREPRHIHSRFNKLLLGKTKTPWRTLWLTLLFICMLVAIIAELIPLYHILGTDKIGRDVFYAAIKSIRTGLVIGTLTTLVMLPFAVGLGTLAGYFRGLIDDIIQYIYTTLSSIPSVLLIAAAVLTLQVAIEKHAKHFELMLERSDLRLLVLCIILGVTSWTSLCRLLRGETLKLRTLDYIEAARALGVNHFRIIFRHILPNLTHIILIAVALDFSGLVLAEAVLSYVGVGVDPSTFSWGNMINGARLEMAREPVVWWSLVGAFIMMFILVLSANVFSDAIRDAFDPRLKNS